LDLLVAVEAADVQQPPGRAGRRTMARSREKLFVCAERTAPHARDAVLREPVG
jgi:hypothetical protein